MLVAAGAVSLSSLLELSALAEPTAGSAGEPIIRKVGISDDETQMLIYARNLCANPVVMLSTIELEVDICRLGSPQLIIADLPEHIDPAGYRL